jgi:hypothetical protein
VTRVYRASRFGADSVGFETRRGPARFAVWECRCNEQTEEDRLTCWHPPATRSDPLMKGVPDEVPTLGACVALVLLALATTASAAAPTREVIPPGSDFVTTDCGYPILVQSEGDTIRTTFTDNQGEVVRQIEVYPGFRWILTNLDTGATYTAGIPGPLKLRFNPDGTTTFSGTGPWGWLPTHPGTGETGVFLLRGHISQFFDAAGDVTSTFTGHTVNICEQLAP